MNQRQQRQPVRGMAPADFAAMTKKQRETLAVGATLCYPQDSYGYVVVKATKTGTVLYAERLKTPDLTTGHQPARFDGPWPVWDHNYTDEEIAVGGALRADTGRVRLTWSEKKQCFTQGGTPVYVGKARYHRNYSY